MKIIKSIKQQPPLIYGSLVLLMLSDIVSYFHIGPLWFIAAAGFVLLPGLLLFAATTRRTYSPLTTLLVSLGLGLTLTMGFGLGINQAHWLFGISHPLSPRNILIVLNVVILLGLAYCAKRPHKALASIPGVTAMDKLTIALLGLGCLLVFFGVNRLNNGGSNVLQLATTACAATIPLYIVLVRKKISSWSYITGLFGLSLILLLQTSLRSKYLVGSDALNEFHVFNLVAHQRFWSISQVRDAYNACLSITILPQMLSSVTGQSGLETFRVIDQVVFSFSALVVYALGRLYLTRGRAFFAGVTFVSFQNYISSMPNHTRQEISLLFFALLIFVSLSKEFSGTLQKALMVIFGLSMAVSHYSTVYVAILLFIGAYLATLLSRTKHRVIRKFTASGPQPITLFIIAILSLFTLLWFSQIVPFSGGPVAYVGQLSSQLLKGNIKNEQADQTSLASQFNLSGGAQNTSQIFNQFVRQNKLNVASSYAVSQQTTPLAQAHLRPAVLNHLLNLFIQIIKKIYKLIVIGSVGLIILWVKKRPRELDAALLHLLVGSAFVVTVSFLLPSFTVNYDQERMFQQLLVVLAIPAVVLVSATVPTRKKLSHYGMALFMGAYILVSCGLLAELAGGWPLSTRYDNFGADYGRYYVHTSEVLSAEWVSANMKYQGIHADDYAANRIFFATTGLHTTNSLFPSNLHGGYLVYYDFANSNYSQTFSTYKGSLLIYNPPTQYLNAEANLTYSNGGSVIYEN